MKQTTGNLRKRLAKALRTATLLPGACALLAGGCAHGPETEHGAFVRVYTPQVPVFLSGPAAVLLTNSTGFSARVTDRGDSAFPGSEAVEGELLGRGTTLIFAPRETGPEDKQLKVGGFSYIWDVASGSGYVLSDALQGYAPVASTLRVTNTVFGAGENDSREATILMNDGSKALFRIWPADPRKQFPTRVEGRTRPPLTLTFAKVRLEPPAADLFKPPEGFTKYATAEALADEIAVRQHNYRRGAREPAIPSVPERK